MMKRMLIMVVALGVCLGAGAKELFKKDLGNAHCKEPVWSFNEKGELSSTKDVILWTNDEYENFELTLEFKVTAEGNGGIIVYSKNNDDWIPESIEIQIADYEYWLKRFGPKGTCGAVFGFQGVDKNYTKPLGECNKLKLVCKGQSIKVYINGELATDFDMSKFTDKDKNPDGSQPFAWLRKRARAEVPTVGNIGFQGLHGKGNTFYRNIKISPLKK